MNQIFRSIGSLCVLLLSMGCERVVVLGTPLDGTVQMMAREAGPTSDRGQPDAPRMDGAARDGAVAEAGTDGAVAEAGTDGAVAEAGTDGAVLSNGATYYVATNGNDANPGTLTQPWQHIAWATCGGSYGCPVSTNNPNTLKAGDTLYIRGGTYLEKNILFANSGTSGSPIVIKTYIGEIAILDGEFSSASNSTPVPVFDIDGQHYITFDGLTIMRGNRANVRIGYDFTTTNIIIRNCDIMNVAANDNSGNMFINARTDNILIENNKLHGRASTQAMIWAQTHRCSDQRTPT